jgi:glycosyltransferase involved in cell wall biosynthesis
MNSPASLVSILIPAYNTAFFEPALRSALSQTYPAIEIIVCDDSPGGQIKAIVDRFPDTRVRFVRNARNLGFAGNFTQCFRLARGEYIKFLNDDDVLHPECVQRLAAGFSTHGPGVTLVTSKRRMINEHNQPLPDALATAPLANVESRMRGLDLGNHVLRHSTNFIGEPSTVLFRKDGVMIEPDNVFRLGGHDYVCLADLSLWLRLLSRGDAVYLPDELSLFRIHANQEQRKPEVALGCITERYHLIDDARALGFLQAPQLYRTALTAVLKMFDATLAQPALDAGARDRLQRLRQPLQAQLQSAAAD